LFPLNLVQFWESNLRLIILQDKMEFDRPFMPGYQSSETLPLSRYLPPLPAGMVQTWLTQNIPAGEWILDPLGSAPLAAIEAARAGYRVLVASNNPVSSFLLELMASAPAKADFQAALAEIASVRRGEERLETYLQSLYLTECDNCNQEVSAQFFLWKRDEKEPYARFYHCPQCGDEGERPITPSDIHRLTMLGSDQLHRSRALGRVSIEKDLAHARASEALNVYLPRPLDFLLTLINKIDGLNTIAQRKQLLYALALIAADEGSTLWPWPGGRTRPRQINTPPQFKEANLWNVIEAAVKNWDGPAEKITVTHWPQLPPQDGGICLFPGRLKALLPLPEDLAVRAAVTIVPRPNQAYWTLSALWSGWLWGREAVLPLKSALERRRYDWQWHANALQGMLKILHKHAHPDLPLLGIIPELSPGFFTAVFVAAQSAGFALDGIALRAENSIAQATWQAYKSPAANRASSIETTIREAVRSHLVARNEPAPYLNLHAAAVISMTQPHTATSPALSDPGEMVGMIQNKIQQIFAENNFARRCEKEIQKNDSGLWCLLETPDPQIMPLSDQIEMGVVRYLDKHPSTSLEQLDAAMCSQFLGLRTPPLSLLQICLDSYAEPVPQSPGYWQLKPREKPALRQQDIQTMRGKLVDLGQRLDYQIEGENPLRWQTEDGETAYMFFLFASSMIGRFVYSPPAIPVNKCILVLPGSRANLLTYKLRRDPRLAEAAGSGWRFLKFRHVSRLGEIAELDRAHFDAVLAQDPVSWEEPVQMSMFDDI
jgi:DNA-directed RNA polymerase subunit M/transcription elongation factor TFIIS